MLPTEKGRRRGVLVGAVRVASVQHPAALRRLRRDGRLHGDGRRIDPHFRAPYTVMRRWLSDHDAAYRGAPYPLWGWVVTPGDLTTLTFHLENAVEVDAPAALLIADVPRSRALVTCFLHWHHVLNGFPIDEELVDAWEAWQVHNPSAHPVEAAPAALRDALEQDWRTIIDRRCCDYSETQATMAELTCRDVVDVVAVTTSSDPQQLARRAAQNAEC